MYVFILTQSTEGTCNFIAFNKIKSIIALSLVVFYHELAISKKDLTSNPTVTPVQCRPTFITKGNFCFYVIIHPTCEVVVKNLSARLRMKSERNIYIWLFGHILEVGWAENNSTATMFAFITVMFYF